MQYYNYNIIMLVIYYYNARVRLLHYFYIIFLYESQVPAAWVQCINSIY